MGAFDEFTERTLKIRWLPPVPLVSPQPARLSASTDASWLIFSRLCLFKTAGCIPAVKPSELIERTLDLQELPDFSILLPQTLRRPYSLLESSVMKILDL